MKRLQECWFKKLPSRPDSKPNAVYLRPLGIVGGDAACEIQRGLKTWIVRESEIKSHEVAMADLACDWETDIAAATNRAKKKTKKAIADELRIDVRTYSKRVEFVAKFYEANPKVV